MARGTNKKRLAILLSTSPQHPNLKTTIRLAQTALAQQVDVYLYLVDDGVYALNDDQLVGLAQQGVKLFACAYGAQRRGIPVSDKANFCGLVVFSDLVKGCDRFIALN
jgi:sulfur relay protein TusB/DsrH